VLCHRSQYLSMPSIIFVTDAEVHMACPWARKVWFDRSAMVGMRPQYTAKYTATPSMFPDLNFALASLSGHRGMDSGGQAPLNASSNAARGSATAPETQLGWYLIILAGSSVNASLPGTD